MNLKKLLDEAKNSLAVLRHDLLLSNGSDVLHCFFEGQTDESFYGTHIRSYLKAEQKLVSHFCGNKDSVYKAFTELHSKIKPPTLGLFFVDKDLDDLIPVNRIVDPAIHVTDTYSIENYLSHVFVIERAIAEIYKLGSGHSACLALCSAYNTEYNTCAEFLTHVMAWILFHRRQGNRPNLNNIKLNEMCEVSSDFIFSARPFSSLISDLDKWTQVSTPASYINNSHQHLLKELSTYKKESILRGKFVLWFVVLFLKAVKSKISDHEPSRTISVDISAKTALDLLGPRCQIPVSLSAYLDVRLRVH